MSSIREQIETLRPRVIEVLDEMAYLRLHGQDRGDDLDKAATAILDAVVGLLRQEDIPKERIQRAMEELAGLLGSQGSNE